MNKLADRNNFTGVVLPYAIAGSLYIIGSDLYARFVSSDVDSLFWFSLLKGLGYVLVTGALVYFLVKNYTKQLLAVNKQYLNVFEALPDAALIIDVSGNKIITANATARDLFGFSKDEFKTLTPLSLLSTVDSEVNLLDYLQNDHEKPIKMSAVTKSGDEFPVLVSCNRMKLSDDNHFKLLILRDLTVLKKKDEELKASETRLGEVLDGVKSVIRWINFGGDGFSYTNREAEELYGYSMDEIKKNKNIWYDSIIDKDKPKLDELLRKFKKERLKSAKIEYRIKTKSGNEKWVEDRIWASRDDTGALKLRGITNDISEKKKLEERHNKYVKEVEGFAFLTAHELRMPLTNILGLVDLIENGESDKEKDELIELLSKSSKELDTVVKKLTEKMERSEVKSAD